MAACFCSAEGSSREGRSKEEGSKGAMAACGCNVEGSSGEARRRAAGQVAVMKKKQRTKAKGWTRGAGEATWMIRTAQPASAMVCDFSRINLSLPCFCSASHQPLVQRTFHEMLSVLLG